MPLTGPVIPLSQQHRFRPHTLTNARAHWDDYTRQRLPKSAAPDCEMTATFLGFWKHPQHDSCHSHSAQARIRMGTSISLAKSAAYNLSNRTLDLVNHKYKSGPSVSFALVYLWTWFLCKVISSTSQSGCEDCWLDSVRYSDHYPWWTFMGGREACDRSCGQPFAFSLICTNIFM